MALKGTFAQRLRVLAGGTFLTLFFGVLGSVTGNSILLSTILMLLVGFLAGLFKNLGDRGSGLSICVYVMFVVTNAYPVTGGALEQRALWILTGGIWNMLVALIATMFITVQQPYRRTIALIWRATATLIKTVGRGWDEKEVRSSLREIFLQEKDVRAAIDHSLAFHESLVHQVSKKKDRQEYQLAQSRKAASLVAAHITAIYEELEGLRLQQLPAEFRQRLGAIFLALQQVAERMSVYVLSMRHDEFLLVRIRLEHLSLAIAMMREYTEGSPQEEPRIIRRILQLSERVMKLVEQSVERLQSLEDKTVYQSYSLVRTLLILHPRHWLRNLRLLFYFNTHTMRYALRTAFAAGLAMLIYKWFDISHGYWITFTVIIILQPYFGTTFTKAIDRVMGTVAGGLVGSLLLRLPAGLHLKEIMFFLSAVAMVYFFRIRYSITTFFITLNLVLLFSISEELNKSLLLIRAACTLGGAAIAVIAAFVLLPTWDRKWLPRHLAAALHYNYDYFTNTFFNRKAVSGWTKYKRNAETENSNAFDSFSRYTKEPRTSGRSYSIYYQFITNMVRITRDLNSIHLEEESKETPAADPSTPEQQELVHECLHWFNLSASMVASLYGKEKIDLVRPDEEHRLFFRLSRQQVVYLQKMLADLKAVHTNLEALTFQNKQL